MINSPRPVLFLCDKDHVTLVADLEDAFPVAVIYGEITAVFGHVVAIGLVHHRQIGGRMVTDKIP